MPCLATRTVLFTKHTRRLQACPARTTRSPVGTESCFILSVNRPFAPPFLIDPHNVCPMHKARLYRRWSHSPARRVLGSRRPSRIFGGYTLRFISSPFKHKPLSEGHERYLRNEEAGGVEGDLPEMYGNSVWWRRPFGERFGVFPRSGAGCLCGTRMV